MKVSTQIAVVALLGGVGAGTWAYWPQIRPHVPASVMAYLPASLAAPAPAATPGGRPGGPGAGGPPPAVIVEAAARSTIVETAESVGTTRAFESVNITSKVSGIVEEILFGEGELVEAGQVLLRFDAAERRADLEGARAAVTTTEAQRQEVFNRLERARALRATGSGADAQVVDLTNQLRTAQSNIESAKARERASLARLDDMIVRAPFAGRVGLRGVSIGALVEPRTVITTLDDLSKVRLDFSVPEALLGALKAGIAVRAKTIAFGERVFAGEVAVIDTRVDTVTRSARLSALLDNTDRLLRPGMFMTVTIEVATRNDAVTVPEEAIVGEGPRQVLFVVKDGRIDRRVVRAGFRHSGKMEILEGVAPGEMVVVQGVQRVRHGLAVTARPAGAAPPQGGTGQRPPPQASRGPATQTN